MVEKTPPKFLRFSQTPSNLLINRLDGVEKMLDGSSTADRRKILSAMVVVRLSPADKAILGEVARARKFETLSEFIRRAVFTYAEGSGRNGKAANVKTPVFVWSFGGMEQIDAILFQLRRIGNLLNQQARAINGVRLYLEQGRNGVDLTRLPSADQATGVLDQVNAVVTDVAGLAARLKEAANKNRAAFP